MYTPKLFAQPDESQLRALIADYPLAALTFMASHSLQACHVPLYLVQKTAGSYVLRGHIAKANKMWRDADASVPALAIFQGPQCYITPNWYPSKHQHGKAVPTWNYTSVHMTGEMRLVQNDIAWKMDMLEQLTSNNEATEPKPWSIHDAPADYIEKLLNAIVGLEIEVNKVEATWKLSQNQSAENYAGVLEGLANSDKLGTDDMLAFMQKYQANLDV